MRILILFLFTTATYSQVTVADDTHKKLIEEKFHPNGALKFQKILGYEEYLRNKYIVNKYTEYYNTGQTRYIINFKESKLNGVLVAYWKNGSIKRREVYKEGSLLDGSCWDQNGKVIECCKFRIPPNTIEN